jgi:rhodanese-related sulfurtransferase
MRVNIKNWSLLMGLLAILSGCFSMEDSIKSAENKPEIIQGWIASLSGQYPKVANVTAKKLQEFYIQSDKPLYLIDHRNLEEQMVSIIPGAVPSRDVDIKDLPKDARIVVYCTIGARSSQYVSDQQKAGIANGREIYNLAGGILAWTFVQGELHNPQKKPTKKVHVFGPAYHVIADGYEGVTEVEEE